MDKALLDFEVSIDADCKLLTVGKPFAIEGTHARAHARSHARSHACSHAGPPRKPHLPFLIVIDLLTVIPRFLSTNLLQDSASGT